MGLARLASCFNVGGLYTGLINSVAFHKGRTIRKVMGGGGGEFSACTNFFFSLTACAGIFFSGEPLCTNFLFQTNIAYMRKVKS